MASVETDRGVKEQLRLYDTRGLHDGLELPKHYYSVADGFVLVYSVDSLESFKKVDILKKEIDKSRDKKEVRLVHIDYQQTWRFLEVIFRQFTCYSSSFLPPQYTVKGSREQCEPTEVRLAENEAPLKCHDILCIGKRVACIGANLQHGVYNVQRVSCVADVFVRCVSGHRHRAGEQDRPA